MQRKKSKPAKAHKRPPRRQLLLNTEKEQKKIKTQKEQHMQKEDKSQKEQNMQEEQNKLPLRQLLVLHTCLTSNKTNWPLKDFN